MLKFKIPAAEFFFTFSRSSGAGGQNVNKVSTKATLQWNVFANTSLPKDVIERFIKKYDNRISEDGILTIVSQKTRSQNLNSTDAIEKLHEMIDSVAVAPKIRKPTKPSRSAVNKRLNEKKSHSDKKKSRQEKY
ncbi:MAG: alternative ribosome rescue aminoacyl-tRNA hydrolase ArfB [Bacteriovorax sp.]|nr:alternative ribosome rescue aminoacyl-tRNA hydrolase ArfB [Bacteriovorax sp.]